ncbi:hypothetical protein JRO89_XS08G0082500 [Xanthoceras sorbifolium]|uniref:3'(2'),5'-bisphosphate nucleotidase n=1 Tax=Xanthoceras sorbifolium TaxID=99658 RepID=A0ABQ8HP16_9ROSI|nr:hypothetical protein JRO89_XS08G0082500 [Xanthoceras sorbifolium]
MNINCLRIVSSQTQVKVVSLFSSRKSRAQKFSSSLVVSVKLSSSVVMSYDKEFAAAKKAASLAARLCQALLSLIHIFALSFGEFGYKLSAIIKVQNALLQSDVQSKRDRSPVTVADYGSQALVSFVLERDLPSEPFSIVAEEDSKDLRKDGAQDTLQRVTDLVNDTLSIDGSYGSITLSTEDVLKAIDSGKSEGGPHGRHWVLDPIDGTKGFVRGDQYAIALALLDEGKVVLGVLACPNLPSASISSDYQHSANKEVGCLFFAEVGAGTYMQPLNGSSPVKVQVTAIENPEEASFFESYEAAHSMHDLSSSIAKFSLSETLILKQKLGIKAPPVRIDSQAKYGALSRGDGAIYLRLPRKGYREKIWDHAAGSIVVTGTDCSFLHPFLPLNLEAGGVVIDAAGNPLDFSKGKYLDLYVGIIVSNQKLMPILMKAVKECLEEKAS